MINIDIICFGILMLSIICHVINLFKEIHKEETNLFLKKTEF